jgi:tyrosyl-tRNA synthetase
MQSDLPILDELRARNLVQDVSDEEALGKLLAGGPVTFYAGYDPTATSLHAGNLVPISVMRHLALRGHKMIAVIGGATCVVGKKG